MKRAGRTKRDPKDERSPRQRAEAKSTNACPRRSTRSSSRRSRRPGESTSTASPTTTIRTTEAFFNTDRDNELGFRTFRIGGKGNIYENLIYNVEFELRGTNSAITYKDIYMEQQNLPWIGHFRAGHFKEPIGLEEFGSDLFLTFMEKSPATQAFTPSRNFGVMVWDNVRSSARTLPGSPACSGPIRPIRRPTPACGGATTTTGAFDARLAWLPYYDEPSNGRYLVHLGGSYSFRHVGGADADGDVQPKRRVQHAQRPGRIQHAVVGRQPRADRLRRRSRQRSMEPAQRRVPGDLGRGQRADANTSSCS